MSQPHSTAPSAPPAPTQGMYQSGQPASAVPYGSPYVASPTPYGSTHTPYGAPSSAPYGAPPPGAPAYGAPAYGAPYGAPPQWEQSTPYGYNPGVPQFPPGTDPEIMQAFQNADRDRSGTIDEMELQQALSTQQPFGLRSVRLMLLEFANGAKRIGPMEFTTLWKAMREWRGIFERFDRDRSGKIDSVELRDALLSIGYAVPPSNLQIFDMKYGQARGLNFDNFVECGLVVKGLTEKFKEKDVKFTGSATLTYEAFMLMVLPYIIA